MILVQVILLGAVALGVGVAIAVAVALGLAGALKGGGFDSFIDSFGPALGSLLLVALFLGSWMLAAWNIFQFKAMAEPERPLRELAFDAVERSWGMLGLMTLMFFFLFGGLFFCFVPGMVLGWWFFLATYIYALDGREGSRALWSSLELLRGRHLDVFVRVLVFVLASTTLSMAAGLVPGIGFVVQMLLIQPLMTLTMITLYRDLKGDEAIPEPRPSQGEKAFAWAMGIGGHLVALAAIAVMLATLNGGLGENLKDEVKAIAKGVPKSGEVSPGPKEGVEKRLPEAQPGKK
jgi:hypothetical protein